MPKVAWGISEAALVATAIATTISSNLLDKHSPRIGVIIFGLLIGFAAFLIPDPNAPITDALWPHDWIHVYCNHAFYGYILLDRTSDLSMCHALITPSTTAEEFS